MFKKNCLWHFVHFIYDEPGGHLLEKSCPLGFPLLLSFILYRLDCIVPFPFGVLSRMRNSIVSVPDQFLFMYFSWEFPNFTLRYEIFQKLKKLEYQTAL